MRYRIDTETNALELCDITKVHVMCVKAEDGTKERLIGHCNILAWLNKLQPTDVLVAHNNINFDYQVLRKLFGISLHWQQVRDTLVLARIAWSADVIKEIDCAKVRKNPDSFPAELIGSYSLKAFGYRLGIPKASYTGTWDSYSDEMGDYCEQDVEVLEALDNLLDKKQLDPRCIELETRFALLIRQQEINGFRFNEQKAHALQAKLASRRQVLSEELGSLVPPRVEQMKAPAYWESPSGLRFTTKKEAYAAGQRTLTRGPNRTRSVPFNPASRQQVATFLLSTGWKPSKFTDTGDAAVDESVLTSIAHPAGPKLAKFFAYNKLLGYLAEGKNAWLKLVTKGRIHGRMNTCGAVTGRCTHSQPNMGQIPSVAKSKDGLLYGDEGGWTTECRELFEADEGWVLVGADASGLELRCLGHYLARWDGGAYATTVCTGDIHTTNQIAFGLPEGKVYRDPAKNGIYCVVYGGGDWKFGITLFPPHLFGKKSDDEYVRLGRKAKAKFKKAIPAYGKLVDAVQATLGKNGYLPGVDGRKLHCRKSYAALNTLLQSAGALIVKWATVRMVEVLEREGKVHGRDFKLVAHIHDEVQVTAPKEIAEHIGQTFIKALAEAEVYFGFRCPLTGTCVVGNNWAETH
jgi:DNA polymerase-1